MCDPHPTLEVITFVCVENGISKGEEEGSLPYPHGMIWNGMGWDGTGWVGMGWGGMSRYKQAAFCYEELLLSSPHNALFNLTYAEVRECGRGLGFIRWCLGVDILAALLCVCSAALVQCRRIGEFEDSEGLLFSGGGVQWREEFESSLRHLFGENL